MTNQFADVLECVRRVGVEAARRGEEIDQLRSFPKELFNELESSGMLEALRPRSYGGLELSLAQVNELIIEGARANGSLGWLMMIGTAQGIGLGFRPREHMLKLLEKFPRLRTRGVFAPKGTATPTEGGYTISGQWSFASGGPDPDLVSGNCVVVRDGKPVIGANGVPQIIMVTMPASDVEPLDTWKVLGMRGTDSRDYLAREVFVPDDMAFDIFTGTNSFDTPASQLPIRVALASGHASVALGIAQGALDEITELAKVKRAAMNPGALLANDPLFRHNLGEQTLRFSAARAMLDQQTEDLEKAGAERRPLTPKETLIGRTMAGYITTECVKVVDFAYTFAGSSSVYNSSSLQRRFRDIHVATQHIAASTESYGTLAAAVLGEELSPAELF